MLIRPPRREPRVLAIARISDAILWAVVDPFEVRSTGTTPITTERAIPRAVRRLVKCTKPTVIATLDHDLAKTITSTARRLGLPLVADRFPSLPAAIAADLFPEFPTQCPTKPLARLATHAIAVVLHAPIHPRKYAKTIRPRTTLHVA
jgi:hypothetical protein